ncbi:hypothetical protein [Methylotenera sp. 1P/1]|uniref:hypothetical protein n=1 Tax=Methylotenera sp. 1P/1 TaxID=1131551 RepID=UPI00047662BC|nr:hypothetical protein [Methylotenera sp. 1P/1]
MSSQIVQWCCSLYCLVLALGAHADMADINRIFRQSPSLDRMEICHGGGCAKLSLTQLSQAEWDQITYLFSPMPEDAQQERLMIARAVGKLESLIGVNIGTAGDKAGTFNNAKFPGQLDCNDESINTTTYLRLLVQAGLVRHHTVEDTRTRHFFFSGWPHTTAVIRQTDTGQRYAVDSWFYDNGQPATIIPFEVWKDGYVPEDSPVPR